MNVNIDYVPLDIKYVDEAVNMVISAYINEKKSISFLPPDSDFINHIHSSIQNLFTIGSGIAAIIENRLVGFLAGFYVDEFFGRYPGVYCPIFGHGATGKSRIDIYRGLYKHAADIWVKNKCVSHAITIFAHDHELVNHWFWQGFGMRCVDAIRETSSINIQNHSSAQIKKTVLKDAKKLSDIHANHNMYYRKSPMFMLKNDEDAVQEHKEWLSMENHHEWVAYHNDVPIGFIRISPTAETFVADHPFVMNINGAYVAENERRTGIGALLLNTVQEWLLQNGYPLCGVDFESINQLGSGFWMKYFTPYTYSLVRRIDERILKIKL